MSELYYLIATKDKSTFTHSGMGLAIVLGGLTKEGRFVPVPSADYPEHGAIFISKEFEKIDQKFAQGELFLIEKSWVKESLNDHTPIHNNHIHHFYTLGQNAKEISNQQLIPIVKMTRRPNPATGIYMGDEMPPPKGHFFLAYGDSLYGPFVARKEKSNWLISAPQHMPPEFNLPEKFVGRFRYKNVEQNFGIIHLEQKQYGISERAFLVNIADLYNVKCEPFDFMSDNELISFFERLHFGKTDEELFSKREGSHLRAAVQTFLKEQNHEGYTERLKRLELILDRFLEISEDGAALIDNYLENRPAGQKYLQRYLKEYMAKNREKYLGNESQKSNQSPVDEHLLLERQIDLQRIESKLHQAQKDYEAEVRRAENLKSQNEKELLRLKENHEREIERLQRRHAQEKSDVIRLAEAEAQYLEQKNSALKEDQARLEALIEEQKYLLHHPELPEKITETHHLLTLLKPNNHLTHQAAINSEDSSSSPSIQQSPSIEACANPLTPPLKEQYLQELSDLFNAQEGPQLTYDEIANLVVTITQSFLTIFSGAPGTGKTSTALKMGRILNLMPESNDSDLANFLTISVGRNWLSSRDLIGFYNALKEHYQPAKTGLYPFLKSNVGREFMKLVLLDEANLSSIEHYWSDFLALSDHESERSLQLGAPNGENLLSLPEGLRFIATINNDATTEPLSPRLLDRAPIILMKQNPLFTAYKTEEQSTKESLFKEGAIPYSQLLEAFTPTQKIPRLTEREYTVLQGLSGFLNASEKGARPIYISPRKQMAITRYLSVARTLNFVDIEPLDFAISQYILPLIEGEGSPFALRLLGIKNHLQQHHLHRSLAIVEEIIARGEYSYQHYSFF